MNAGLLFLAAVVVAGFVLLFITTALERLIALPVQLLLADSGDNSCLACFDPHDKREGNSWASS